MAWDDIKSTLESRPDVPDDKKLTAAEWNAMTADQQAHSTRHEQGGSDELDVSNLSGVLADAQTPQTEAVQDIVGALVTGGTNVTVTYDDANDVLTVDTSALNTEEVEDAVGALVTAGNAITVNYDDGANTLSIGVNESALSFYDGTNLTAPVDNQSVSTEDETIKNSQTVEEGAFIGINPNAPAGESGIKTNFVSLAGESTSQAFDVAAPTGGFIFVKETKFDSIAVFGLRGSEIILFESLDPAAEFGTAAGTSVYNLYFDTNDVLTIENTTGGRREFVLRLIA